MEIEDHLAAAEHLVKRIEAGEMRLAEAIAAFREVCAHLAASDVLLATAEVEVRELLGTAADLESPADERHDLARRDV